MCNECLITLVSSSLHLNHDRNVTIAEGEKMAKETGAMFAEVSAKSGHNIRQLFNMIASVLMNANEGTKGVCIHPCIFFFGGFMSIC